jgi:hypothetical protein
MVLALLVAGTVDANAAIEARHPIQTPQAQRAGALSMPLAGATIAAHAFESVRDARPGSPVEAFYFFRDGP